MTRKRAILAAGLSLALAACTGTSGGGGGPNAGALCPGAAGDGGQVGDGGPAGDGGPEDGGPPAGVACDPRTGLHWQLDPPAVYRTQGEAATYCDDLVLGGIDGWRLPTISELRSLVEACPATVIHGECKVEDPDCLSAVLCFDITCNGCGAGEGPGENGCFFDAGLGGPCGLYWSSSLQDGLGSAAYYILDFVDAKINRVSDTLGGYVRCVHAREGLPDLHEITSGP